MKPLFCSIAAIAILLLTGCAGGSLNQQQYQQAKTHYSAEEYQLSYKSLLPLAKSGDAKAQYAIGYMYYHGKGVDADETVAKIWIRNAAEQGYMPAQQALMSINNYESADITTGYDANPEDVALGAPNPLLPAG